MMQAHERLSLQLDKHEERYRRLEDRVDDLERESPMNKQVRNWIFAVVTGIVSMVGVFAAKFMGLM